jgi:2-amino-4-hydroxy-6-hydroxymethyldihydropteridine diphosphokinase
MAAARKNAYLGLGSNVGDRLANLRSAVALFREVPGIEVVRASSVYETEPVGAVLDQRDFYNAVVEIETALDPYALLAECKRIERELGRRPAGVRGGPRPIDADLLLVGTIELDEERLALPHRELANRRFVIEPLLELAPQLELPDGTLLAERLASLGYGQRVTRVARALD